MNEIERLLPRCLAMALLVLASTTAAAEGKWLERGAPLTEFPACYQLWSCVPADVEGSEAHNQAVGLPKGTWGTCENMMIGEQAGCGRCVAPPPEDQCNL